MGRNPLQGGRLSVCWELPGGAEYICIWIRVCMRLCMHLCIMYVCMYVCMYVHVCISMCVCMYVCIVCMHACMDVCTYVCMYVCMQEYIDRCIFIHTQVCFHLLTMCVQIPINTSKTRPTCSPHNYLSTCLISSIWSGILGKTPT